jgi:NAD(P)-dependent dehydrogenase (short-subunit alcohol dehydrogenase family)
MGLLARGEDGLDGARAEVEAAGGRALAVATDVSRAEDVERAAEEIERKLGPIDVWVNNAMVSVFSPFSEMTADEFRRVTEVTYLGVVYGTMAALKRMIPRDRGTIVQVGSALAYRSIPLQSAYCGAKHAIRGFTDSIRCELAHDRRHVRITMVQMPALNTPQFSWVRTRLPRRPQPVPPIFEPEVAALAIAYASRRPRREIDVGGSTVAAIVGNAVAPRLLDRYLGRTGYASQQTAEPLPAERPDNLFAPVAGDHGAHGRFDVRSRRRSVELWATTHRGWIAGAIATGAVALAGAVARRRR